MPSWRGVLSVSYSNKGDYPEGLSGSFYDLVLLLGKAVSNNTCSGENLRDYLAGVKSFTGIAGTYGVNTNREFEIPVELRTIQNVKIVPFK